MAEKEFLMRKVQFLQHYGSVVPSSLDSGGFFTENRSNLRKGGDLKVHRDLQKLNVRIFFSWYIYFTINILGKCAFFYEMKIAYEFSPKLQSVPNQKAFSITDEKILMMMFSIPNF